MNKKYRKIAALCLALSLCFAAVPADNISIRACAAGAGSSEVIEECFACVEFSTLSELCRYAEDVSAGIVDLGDLDGDFGAYNYLDKFDTFYIPKIFEGKKYEYIRVSSDNVQIECVIDGKSYTYTFYFDEKNGKKEYENILEKEKLYEKYDDISYTHIPAAEGDMIIMQQDNPWVSVSTYYWKQDGVFMYLTAYDGEGAKNTGRCAVRRGIMTPAQLMNIKKDNDCVILCDIDLTDTKWKSIKEFSGTLDGKGHSITGLRSDSYGLFFNLKSGAEIKDIRLEEVNIRSYNTYAGAIAASVLSGEGEHVRITNCFVDGVVASCREKYRRPVNGSTAGALVGRVTARDTVISGCYSNAIVAAHENIGGLVGINYGVIEKSAFDGQLVNSHNIYELAAADGADTDDYYAYSRAAGGICALNYGIVRNCANSGRGIENASYYGGIAGRLVGGGCILSSVNLSEIYNDYDIFGGHIAGYAGKSSSLEKCYTISGYENKVPSDVGKSFITTVTYAVRPENMRNLKAFRNLDDHFWTIGKSGPVPAAVSSYDREKPSLIISSGRIIENKR